MMRLTPRDAANGIAWLGILLLIGLAAVLVSILGFPGVLLLGLLTTLICVRAELAEAVPTWSRAMFESRMRGAPPRGEAALREERRLHRASLRYYRGCGLVLIAAGLAGTLWQIWR
ncbi:hypothetical protein ACVMLK_12405 [Teichococcus aerofrigidensis]